MSPHSAIELARAAFEARRPELLRTELSMGECHFTCFADGLEQFSALERYVPWLGKRTVRQGARSRDWIVVSIVAPDLLARLREVSDTTSPDQVITSFLGQCYHGRYGSMDGPALFMEVGPEPVRDYAVCRLGGSTVMVVRASAAPGLHTYMIRVLREIYLRESENLGAVMLHASSVACGEAAAIIVGPKAAGKTSLAMTLCLGAGCDYLANDRVLLTPDPEDGRQWIAPFPLACRIGVGTARAFPKAGSLLASRAPLHRQQNAALFAPDPGSNETRNGFGSDVKLELTPLELRDLLGFRLSSGAWCRVIVLTRLNPGRRQAELTRLRADELVAGLQSEVLTPHEEKWVEPWLVNRLEDENTMTARVRKQLERFAASCPGYLLQYGYDYAEGGRPCEAVETLARMLRAA